MQDDHKEKLSDLQKMNEFIVNKSYGWELLKLWAKPLTNDDSARQNLKQLKKNRKSAGRVTAGYSKEKIMEILPD